MNDSPKAPAETVASSNRASAEKVAPLNQAWPVCQPRPVPLMARS
jgi:hypothetical protein